MIVAGYILFALVLGIVVSQSNSAALRNIRTSSEYKIFVTHRNAILSLLLDSRTKDVTEEQKFVADVSQDPTVVRWANVVDQLQLRKERLRDWPRLTELDLPNNNDPTVDPTLGSRVLAVTAAKLLIDRFNDLILIGDLTSTIFPLVFLLVVLLAAYFAFQVQSVFHTPQLMVVYSHPQYPILFIQLSIILVAPCLLLVAVEATYWPDYQEMVRSLFGALQVPSASRFGSGALDLERFLRVRSGTTTQVLGEWLGSKMYGRPPLDAWHLTAIAFLLPAASVMAIAIWLTRRFSWSAFLTGLVGCGVVFLLLLLLRQSGGIPINFGDVHLFRGFYLVGASFDADVQAVLLVSAGTFLAAYILGVRAVPSRLRRYFICAGYTGFLFSVTVLAGYSLGLPIRHDFLAAIISVSITIVSVSIVELLLRRLMRSYLYDPQP